MAVSWIYATSAACALLSSKLMLRSILQSMCDTICFMPEKECDLQQRQHSQKQLHFHVFLYRNDKLLADAIKNVSRNVPFSIREELYGSSFPSRQHFKNNGVPIHCVAFSAERGRFFRQLVILSSCLFCRNKSV